MPKEKMRIFKQKKKRIYLDAAAGLSGNPSSPHAEGRQAREELEEARERIARCIEVKTEDVVFTSGATEANALAILGAVRKAREEQPGIVPHVLYLPSAHASLVENVEFAKREGALVEPLPLVECRVDCDLLGHLLRPETVLIAMEAVCGETGVVWNTREVARAARHFFIRPEHASGSQTNAARRGLVHVDASQAAWSEKLTREHFGATSLALDASKVSETRGIGALALSHAHASALAPLYGGGSQEQGLRPGSPAPHLAGAFAEALQGAAFAREGFCTRAVAMRASLVKTLSENIPHLLVNEGAKDAQAPHILNISLPGRDTDYLLALLDEAGFAISTVSACETASGEPSRAVFALFGDSERASTTLRISWGGAVRPHDLARFATALVRSVHFIDNAGSK